jgi:hypothetical protein
MLEEKSKRKPRVPLSSEELFYYKKLKVLNEQRKIEDFKKSTLFIAVNRLNVILASFLTYGLFSILVACHWEKSSISSAACSYEKQVEPNQVPSINAINIITSGGERIQVKTKALFDEPQANDIIFIGRDFIFNKTLKVKLGNRANTFWHFNTYPILAVILFALGLGFFIYNLNRHLNVNGLLTSFGLFILASLYFLLV